MFLLFILHRRLNFTFTFYSLSFIYIVWITVVFIVRAHSELCQASKMKRFAITANGFHLLTILQNAPSPMFWQGSELASENGWYQKMHPL